MIDDPLTDGLNHPQAPDDESFACACGDPACRGDGNDAANIKLGSAWYAADCEMANAHPEVVRDRALQAQRDRWLGK